jgi:aspartyl-tRNA(Asn)/glutamyl-tRNA(Gln) amidotransferase subunit C
MARITREEVERIADLARLTLAPDEVERMTGDLETILEYVATLQRLDTREVVPTSHVIPMRTPLREDRAERGLAPEQALANAPERNGDAFVVPKVIAEDEA